MKTDKFGPGFENLFQIFGCKQKSEDENICEVPTFEGGYYEIPKKPGLGVDLISENIQRYAQGKIICK